jgi:polar amino acid transport system permease protein
MRTPRSLTVTPAQQDTRGGAADPDAIIAIPQRHWGRVAAAILVTAGLALIVATVATSKSVQWNQVRYYLFYRTILEGSLVTIKLTVLSMTGGIIVGIGAALMRLSPNRVLTTVSTGYIWLFRGTPLLVQIIFWYNLALFVPRLGVGSFSVSTNTVMTSFVAALIALTLNTGAYMTEVVRGGILSVDEGQTEAALALGLSRRQTTVRIVLPQALRVIVPTTGNQLIGLLKDTSLVSVIAAQELLTQAQIIYSRTFLIIELLMVASFWYLVMTTIASIGQSAIERRLGLSTRSGQAGPRPGLTLRRRRVAGSGEVR